jgi:hypothetical protein
MLVFSKLLIDDCVVDSFERLRSKLILNESEYTSLRHIYMKYLKLIDFLITLIRTNRCHANL